MSVFSDREKGLLEKTLDIRERMLDTYMAANNGKLPTDEDGVNLVNKMLDGIDRSLFGRGKLKIEESASRSQEETKALLTELLVSIHQNPVRHERVIEGQVLELPDHVSKFEFRDEERMVQIDTITIDEFNT